MAAEYIETQSLDHLKWNEKKFSQVYMWGHGDDEDEKPDCVDDDTWQSMMTDPEIQKKMQEEVDQLKRDLKDLRCDIIPSGDTSWPLPLNVSRLITNAQRMFQVSGGAGTSYLTPMGIMDEIKKLTTSKLVVVVGDDLLSKEAQANSTILFSSLIRCKLASKRVLMEYGLTRQAFEWLMGEIEHRFLVSQAQPGEMIGCLAAQSVGEPATQMTLNVPLCWCICEERDARSASPDGDYQHFEEHQDAESDGVPEGTVEQNERVGERRAVLP